MKAVILARVSTEEQKEAGNSLPAQIDRLERYCKTKELEIAKVFSFDESAYKTKRDDFDKALEYLKSAKEKIAVCFDKVDRFSRNVFDKRVASLYDLAMEDKIELHFASDNLIITPNISATEKFHFSMNLGLAKYYSDAISDSVNRAYENKVKKGEWIGKSPIGYIDVKNETKDKIPDPARSHFIPKIFQLYSTANCSIKQIAEKMKELGLTGTIEGKPVSGSMVYSILKNPFYYGEMRIKKGPLKGLHPHKYEPLISKELFIKCQDVMAEYHRKPLKYASKPYILRGMIKCPSCGCMITPETKKGHNYYHCTNYKKLHDKVLFVREEDLLAPIFEVLKGLRMPEDKIQETTQKLKEINENKNYFHKRELAKLRREYDQIDGKVSRLFDLRLEDQSITKDMFNEKLKEFKEKQAEINERVQRYTNADESFYLTANRLLNVAKRALDIFKSSEPMEKRQFLGFLLQNLTLDGKKLNFELKTPFDTVLQANRCSDWLRGQDSNLQPGDYT